MKTKLFLLGLLVIAIQVMVMGQAQTQNVLLTRVSKSTNAKPIGESGEKQSIGQLNERISDYDAQILAITRKKAELNADINNFFEGNKQAKISDEDAEVRMAIASLESDIDKSFEAYEKNNNALKDIVIGAVDKEIINDQLIDLMAGACKLAISARLIKSEAYDISELPAREGILGNSLEKISSAISNQDQALQKLGKPAGEKGVCYTKK
jgi:hypothetical protein